MLTINKTEKPDYKGYKITRVERRETNRFNRVTKKYGPRTSVTFEAYAPDGEYFNSNRTLKILKRSIDWAVKRGYA